MINDRKSTFGLLKWRTEPSSLNMLTSSIPGIGLIWSFFNWDWSFLSSVLDALWTIFFFLRAVPFHWLDGHFSVKDVSENDNFQNFYCKKTFKPSLATDTDAILKLGQLCRIHFDRLDPNQSLKFDHAILSTYPVLFESWDRKVKAQNHSRGFNN